MSENTDYDQPLDLTETDSKGRTGIMLVTDHPNIVLSMLHDMAHFVLTDDGFEAFMKHMEAKYPEHVKHMVEDHHIDLRGRSRSALEQLLEQIHEFHEYNMSTGEMS